MWNVFAFSLAILLICDCSGASVPEAQGSGDLPRKYESFFQLSMKERRERIFDFSLEEQVDVYLLSTLVLHPPDLELANCLATHGSAIVPALLERLGSEEADSQRVDLLLVFTTMQSDGRYSVRDDSELMSRLEESVESMSDPSWRSIGREMLAMIRAQGAPEP